MNTANRLALSEKKNADERNNAMSFNMGDIFSFYKKLSPLMQGTVYRQYTKKGPGRYHQHASKAEIKRRKELKQ